MKRMLKNTDYIISQPDSGQGTTVKIRYDLSR
jgi:hypothetical protein